MGWQPMLDVEIQPLSLSMAWPQLRFPSPPHTNNITSHSCSFSSTMFCKKNKQTTSQVIEFLFRFCLFEAWSFARQKNKTKTSRSQLDFLESHCSLVSDAQCDLDWAELDNCVPFPDQYLESEHGPRHREAEDRLDSSKLIHGFSKLLHGFVKIDTWISLSLPIPDQYIEPEHGPCHWETEGRLESASLAENPLCELVVLQHNYKNSVICGTQVQSLSCHSVSPFLPIWIFVKVGKCNSLSCSMDLSKFIHQFL